MEDPVPEPTMESDSVVNTVVEAMTESADDWVNDVIYQWLDNNVSDVTGMWIVILGTLVAAILVHFLTRTVIVFIIRRIVEKTRTKWDDFLVQRRVFARTAHLAPAIVVYLAATLFLPPFFLMDLESVIQRFAIAYMIFTVVFVVSATFNVLSDIYGTFTVAKHNPISGFVQAAKLLVWVVGGVFMVAELTGWNPSIPVAGIGAATAVVLVIFKDSILGFVASIQIIVNNLVNIGDWIEMPKFDVDGDVTDITLTTIMIRNFDNTISTIPTHAVISESFKNWRGMQESGGRRIKRSVCIDMNSIRFCTDEMIARFTKFALLSDYIKQKQQDVVEYNQKYDIDTSEIINGRRLTNVGTFRAYLKEYLNRHEKIHRGMTFLIRQLPPSERGLPLEIYVFCSDTSWINYEEVQADIFDHILAVIPEFGLNVFQNPTGNDFQRIGSGA